MSRIERFAINLLLFLLQLLLMLMGIVQIPIRMNWAYFLFLLLSGLSFFYVGLKSKTDRYFMGALPILYLPTCLATLAIWFTGGTSSILFPELLLLPVLIISLNLPQRLAIRVAVLNVAIIWLYYFIQELPIHHYGSTIFLLLYSVIILVTPQIMGYLIRQRMRIYGKVLDEITQQGQNE